MNNKQNLEGNDYQVLKSFQEERKTIQFLLVSQELVNLQSLKD
jgi:SUMO ligase MMS21 Smc5/6 complex component